MENRNINKGEEKQVSSEVAQPVERRKDASIIPRSPEQPERVRAGLGNKGLELKPEVEDRLRGFNVEIEVGGKPQVKTALDAIKGMDEVLLKKVLTDEQRAELIMGNMIVMGELLQKYKETSVEGKELRDICFKDILAGGDKEKGQELQEWFQNQAKQQKTGEKRSIDADGLAKIMSKNLKGQELVDFLDILAIIQASMTEGDGQGGAIVEPVPLAKRGESLPSSEKDGGHKGEQPAPVADEADGKGGVPPGGKKGEGASKLRRLKEYLFNHRIGAVVLMLVILYLSAMGKAAELVESAGERAASKRAF